MTQPKKVIGPQFLTTSSLDLIITTKKDAPRIVVTDVNGKVVFTLKKPSFSLGKLLLLDAAGNILVTLREKTLSAHNRWNVYRGDSTSDSDSLFSVKVSSLLQWGWKMTLDVFLAANTSENVCDFHIKGRSQYDKSCDIYLGNSTHIVAQMHRKKGDPSRLTVYPNVDYAFVVASIVIATVSEPGWDANILEGGKRYVEVINTIPDLLTDILK